MKRIGIFSLIALMSITSIFFTSCNTVKQDLQNSVKNDVYDNYEALKEKMEKSENEEEFAKSLAEFCEDKNLETRLVTPNNVVVNIDATEGYQDAEKNIFLVEFSKNGYKEYCQNLAVAIAFAQNSEFHGKVEIIMSSKVAGISTGVNQLEPEYFDGANLIEFSYNSENISMIYGSAKTKEYNITKKATKVKSSGNLAYKINISGLRSGDSGDRSSKHTNPIVFLGDWLSNSKSSGLNIEIASFTSDGDITKYPTEAEVIIVVDDSSRAKWESRLEKAQESFKDKTRKNDEDAKFEFSEVEVPSNALDYDDTTKLLCLLYTMEDGLFATTEEDYEGDPLGITTLASISISDQISLKVMSRSIDEATELNMDTAFTMTANLSDFGISISQRNGLWTPKEANEIIAKGSLEESLKGEGIKISKEYSFVESPCSIIQGKNSKLNMISLGFNIDEGTNVALSIIDYLETPTKE